MTTVAIPGWNAQGVIPPINELQPTSVDRSPYTVSLTDFVLRFGLSAERRTVLDGFLRYRASLHVAGLVQGFQWLDGSFLEHVEMLESRPPNDIDVVTFYRLPVGKTQQDLQTQTPDIFPIGRASQQILKANYHVDAYTVHLEMVSERLVKQGTYWYSMWSHRRNPIWKGYVQVDLAPVEDIAAQAALTNFGNQGVEP